jgi:hypothetical protein
VNVGQDGAGNPTASVAQQTTFGGGDNVFYWMPSLAVNNAQRTAISFLRSSPTIFLGSAWAAKDLAATGYSAAQILRNGTCTRTDVSGSTVRTGDYLGAHTATDLASFWLTGEYATIEPANSGFCSWRTEILQVN